MRWIETLLRDVSYGARLFRRQPGATFLAVLTLSLGIGANAAIYSVLHAALLRPLPFPDPERLVSVVDHFRVDGVRTVPPTVPELLDVRAASRHLQAISFFDMRDVQIGGGTEPARAFAARAEAGFLGTLGVQPALGRLFTPDDHMPGRDRVVVLTDSLWRGNFGADPAVINQRIVVNGVGHDVIGVLPSGFSFDYLSAEPIELYVPFPMNATYTARTAEFANVRRVTAVARVKPGVTLEQAAAEVEAVSQRIRADHPQLYRRGSDGQDRGFYMSLLPLREIVAGRGRDVVLLLFGAVGLVLLIACVNTAQFLLARAVERQQEVAIRFALGAGAGRLLRQFVTEAALLAFIAAALGILQAIWLINLLAVLLSSRSPLVRDIGLDMAVIGFSLGVAVLVALGCGLFPAMHVARRSSAVGVERTTGAARSRTRHVLIAMQVAVSVVLLVCAGLLAQSIRDLRNAPRGYSTDDVTVMRMRIAGRAGAGGIGATYQRYLSQVAAVPGVQGVAVADAPLHGFPGVEFTIIGGPEDAATLTHQRASWRIVSPGYFGVLGIPLLAGRSFAEHDTADRPHVAIVNEEMARRFWPGRNPIGAQIRSGSGPRSAVATIVGIAGNVRPVLQREMVPQIYVSYLQQAEPNITLLVRSTAGLAVPVESIKQAVWRVVPEQPLFDIRSMADVVERPMTEPRLIARLLGAFALLALLMSTLGVYTVVSYLTARRTKEVALRRAIGADSLDVMRLLGIPTLGWTLVGLTLGVGAAVAAARLLRTVVLRDARVDVPTIVAIAVLYVIVAGIAVAVPAARALRIQPAHVLRAE